MSVKTPITPESIDSPPVESKNAGATRFRALQTTMVIAALLECLILLGGLSWAMQATNGAPRFIHILLVVAAAVLCGAIFALVAALRFRASR